MTNGIGFDGLLGFLRDSPFFNAFAPTDLAPLLDMVQLREVPAGESIFGQGDAADAFYVVYSGVVSLDRNGQGGAPRHLGRCEPHACFGEQGIVDSEPRLAAATALEDSVVLRFPRVKFERLVADGNPTALKLTLQLARTISKRLRNQLLSSQ